MLVLFTETNFLVHYQKHFTRRIAMSADSVWNFSFYAPHRHKVTVTHGKYNS